MKRYEAYANESCGHPELEIAEEENGIFVKYEDLKNEVLDLIVCAEDYGFKRDVLFAAFRDMINSQLTDKEIEKYSRDLESEEGYGEEDYESAKSKLSEFKNEYCS